MIGKSQGQEEKLWSFINGLILFYGIVSGRNLCSKGIAFFLINASKHRHDMLHDRKIQCDLLFFHIAVFRDLLQD